MKTVSDRELALLGENKRLMSMQKLLMNNDQYGIIVTDLNGTVIECNDTAEYLLGQKAQQMLGSPAKNIAEIGAYIVEVLNEKKRFEKIHVNFGKTDELICLVDVIPIVDDNNKQIGAFVRLQDVTEAYRVNEQFNYMSNHDEHTGLPNRNYLKDKIASLIEENNSTRVKEGLAVIHFGLDRFKIVNDTVGYTDGDKILKTIVRRLKNSLGPNDFIARVGGDEFVIVAPFENRTEVFRSSERLLSLFNDPFVMKGYEFHITVSVGVALHPDDDSIPEELLFKANTAMSYAKKSGKNQFVIYSKNLESDAHERIVLEASFRKALDSDELILYYQPKIDIKTGRIIGVEALVRWQHLERGLMLPAEFIPMAEETGLISQLDEWVLRKACEQNKKWLDSGLPPISVAVNLSSVQFASPKLEGLIETILKETGLKPEYLELEITETMAMNVDYAIPTLNRLDALGVKISLDDFGTGFSSMNYLTKFTIDRLKIDRSFIWNIDKSASDSNIVVTIIRLAHSLGLKVIAEGVEDNKQLQFLDNHGCDEVQGFFYSKPVPAEGIQMSPST